MNRSENYYFQQGVLKNRLSHYLQVHPYSIRHISETNRKSPFDFLYNDKRYEVKLSNPVFISRQKKKRIWDFDLRGNYWEDGVNKKTKPDAALCDYYLLAGMEDNRIKRVFLLPSTYAPMNHIRISVTGYSKYHQYEI